jgi:leucyl-tRNA synthetase
MVYKEGFYHGTIIVGEYAGRPVQEVKPLIRQYLIDQGLAFAYCEPEGLVISRSGDECVVTLADQWYMNYGEETWKAQAIECVNEMELYSEEARNSFMKTLEWLSQWACSRSFGLGSRLPWDKQWLIESLSDSTIYMAYYTVAHILHQGSLDGSTPNAVLSHQMTDEIWSYIMLDEPLPKTDISPDVLEHMKREFNFFYPLDLRTSGKDLINNHLTFFIYNHCAIFPKEKWPKSIRVNGHLLLNNEKMSKSTGNFLTVRECLNRYGADATRFALGDAGDGLEDANFMEKTADDAILKLFTERDWIQESLSNASTLRTGPYTWNDKVFVAEMDQIISTCDEAYSKMLYREAIKIGYYDLQNARNEYRKVTTGQGLSLLGPETFEGMHVDLIKRFARVQALLLSPITPHWSESIWLDLLGEKDTIMNASWPEHGEINYGILAGASYLRSLISGIRSTEDQLAKKKNKKGVKPGPHPPCTLTLFVASSFPKWQEDVLASIKPCFDGKSFKGERDVLKAAGLDKDKRVMPFVSMIKVTWNFIDYQKNVEASGIGALDRALVFPEWETLQANLDTIRRDLYGLVVKGVTLVNQENASAVDVAKAEGAVPGQPSYSLTPL